MSVQVILHYYCSPPKQEILGSHGEVVTVFQHLGWWQIEAKVPPELRTLGAVIAFEGRTYNVTLCAQERVIARSYEASEAG